MMFHEHRRGVSLLACCLVLAAGSAALPAQARTHHKPTHMGRQPVPRSHYADGTGNSDVDRLNAGQLDANYAGWRQVAPGTPGSRPTPPPLSGPPMPPSSGG